MLGSRIICEGKSLKTEGIVKYAEGHFIVVELLLTPYEVGQSLHCKIFGYQSTRSFQTTVVGKKNDHIIINAPSEIREQWMISRETLRFPIDMEGQISAVSFSGTKPLVELMQPYSVHVHDISEGGIGFSSPNYIREGAIALIHFLLLNEKMYLEIEIVQYKYPTSDKRFYYGGKFKDLTSPSYQIIRTFTFQSQLKRLMNRENEGG
ncbi:PilZ domain-containing protein [Tepidibacillus marianensis]|uniref:PilZ domain-containing protein n=1 Tax=Tepidibacillus marianensis TaxID=3131995 RepID=UPI0030D2196F